MVFHVDICFLLNLTTIKKIFIGNGKNQVNLVVDLGSLFSGISLKETNTIMIPETEAVLIADELPNLFSMQ